MKTCFKCKKNYPIIFNFCSIDGQNLIEESFFKSNTQDLSGKLETINLSQLPFSQSFAPQVVMPNKIVYLALATTFCSTVFLSGSLIGVIAIVWTK